MSWPTLVGRIERLSARLADETRRAIEFEADLDRLLNECRECIPEKDKT